MAYCGAKKLCDEDSKGSTISTLSRAGELNRRSLYSPMRGLVPVASSVGALWSLSIEVSQLAAQFSLPADAARSDPLIGQCIAQINAACWARPGGKCGIYGA